MCPYFLDENSLSIGRVKFGDFGCFVHTTFIIDFKFSTAGTTSVRRTCHIYSG